MKKLYVPLLLLLLLAGCEKEVDIQLDHQHNDLISFTRSKPIDGQYIVVLKEESVTPFTKRKNTPRATLEQSVQESMQKVLQGAGVSSDHVQYLYASVLPGFAVDLTEQQLEKIRQDPAVDYVEQDQMIIMAPGGKPGKPGGGGSGGSDPQVTPWGISRVGGSSSGQDQTAWILDSGIDLDHPDLNVDAERGFSVFTRGKDASLDDGNGHGTHVAGTIAALDNDIGVVGVAAGAKVVPVKVLSSRGSGSISGVIAGVEHVGAHAANGDVANMSLGGGVSQALDDAVKAASSACKFVLAAGNDRDDANSYSPARVNGSNIYTISAMSQGDNWASFSNYGNPPVDYCAPGVSINSTWKDGGYRSISGTSMAAPHVAGILLLGNIQSGGTVNGDPDNNADAIATR